MMAVDSKQSGSELELPVIPGTPARAITGPTSANGSTRSKRPSQLLATASSLPSVESSLDDFIARANDTLIDSVSFNTGDKVAAEDAERREADGLRWQAAEQQMRESEAREQ